MSVRDEMEQRLREKLDPTELEVIDNSPDHVGHVGNLDGKGGTHFRVNITSSHFKGLSPVEAHRVVYSVLDDFLKGSVHALEVDTKVP